MCVCAFVFSYICLFQASLVLFTRATFFFLLLGQLCGFGACNKRLYKIPNYTSHFKTMRTAGRGVIKGSSSDPPAAASLPGVQTPEQHKHSQRLPVPPLLPPPSPPAPACPPGWSELAPGAFASRRVCWIFLPFLCLGTFGIHMDF